MSSLLATVAVLAVLLPVIAAIIVVTIPTPCKQEAGVSAVWPSFTRPVLRSWGGKDDWEFHVSSIGESRPFECYRILVLEDHRTVLGVSDLAAGEPWEGTPTTLHLNITDEENDEHLSVGDIFVLGNVLEGRQYAVVVFWEFDGEEISRRVIPP